METITSFIDGGGNVLVAASSDIGQLVSNFHCSNVTSSEKLNCYHAFVHAFFSFHR